MNTVAKTLEVNMKSHQETRVALLEQSIGYIHESLERLEKRFDRIDERFDRIDKKFDLIDHKIDKVRDKMDGTTKWLIGLGVSVLFSAATLGFSIYQNLHI